MNSIWTATASWLQVDGVSAHLLDCATKSILVMSVAAICVRLIRRRSPAVRHWVWTLGFLSLLALPGFEFCVPSWTLLTVQEDVRVLDSTMPTLQSSAPDNASPAAGTRSKALASEVLASGRSTRTPSAAETSYNGRAGAEADDSVRQAANAAPMRGPLPSTVADSNARVAHSIAPSQLLVGLWLLGVMLALTRWAAGAILTQRLVSRSSMLPASTLHRVPVVLRRAGLLGRLPAILVSQEARLPFVTGILKPKIILPHLSSAWSDARIRAVLEHELAHLARKDLEVQSLVNLCCAFYWFNPVVWIAAARMRIERELACDAQVLTTGIEPVRYAQELLDVARSFSGRTTHLGLPMVRPVEVEGRIAAILGPTLPHALGRRWSRASAVGALLTTAILASSTVSTTSVPLPVAAAAPAVVEQAPQRVELHVEGPDGTPIADAEVEIRSRPRADESWLEEGDYVRGKRYGVLVKTNKDGKLVLTVPPGAKPRFMVSMDRFAPYLARWGNEALPERFTIQLDAAVSIGGVVVDPEGNPIVGANVRPSVEYKKRPDDRGQLGYGATFMTDANGRWLFKSMPAKADSLWVEITHPDFRSLRRALSLKQFQFPSDGTPQQNIVMDRGLSVSGTVTGPDGLPLADALLRAKFGNDLRQARTDSEGLYKLTGCDTGLTRIVVSATGMATDMLEVTITEETPPVDFSMKPGGHVRIRVVDEDGMPVPQARIFFQRWRDWPYRYFELDHVHAYANDDGVWEWNEAPLDEFEADISGKGLMPLSRQSMIARKEEYLFVLPPQLVILGKVVDAETKEPITDFRVRPGVVDPPNHRIWFERAEFAVSSPDGRFELPRSEPRQAHMVKIIAPGYLATDSREIAQDEGRIELEFALKPAQSFDFRVMTPDGQPASGARAALGVSGAQISIEGAGSEGFDEGSTYAPLKIVNAVGRVRFPAQAGNYEIVVLHDSGYAHFKATDGQRPNVIQLERWAEVEGIFAIAGVPQPGVRVYLSTDALSSYGRDTPNVHTSFYTTTDQDGRYHFRVPEGNCYVRRDVLRMVGEGSKEATSSATLHALVEPGGRAELNFGQSGRAVVGKLVPPKGFKGQVHWSFADIDVEQVSPLRDPPYPDELKDAPAERSAWLQNWLKSPEGVQWRSEYEAEQAAARRRPRYFATCDAKDSFRIDDVAPGDYELSVRFWEKQVGSLSGALFSVPEMETPHPTTPVQLGSLHLTP